MIEYRGFKITTAVKRLSGMRTLTTKIDGHVIGVHTAIHPNRDAAIQSAKLYINDSIDRPDAYEWTRHLTSAQFARKG